MKKQFSTGFLGYKKEEVDRYLEELTRDYEEELRKKRERMTELAEETRNLKHQNQEQSERIERFIEQEKYISRALITAEQRSQAIVEEGRRKSREEMDQFRAERERWRSKFREIRRDLLDFERTMVNLIERFRDEINYYTAKEISEALLEDEAAIAADTDEPSSAVDFIGRLEETGINPMEEKTDEEKKEKVIA